MYVETEFKSLEELNFDMEVFKRVLSPINIKTKKSSELEVVEIKGYTEYVEVNWEVYTNEDIIDFTEIKNNKNNSEYSDYIEEDKEEFDDEYEVVEDEEYENIDEEDYCENEEDEEGTNDAEDKQHSHDDIDNEYGIEVNIPIIPNNVPATQEIIYNNQIEPENNKIINYKSIVNGTDNIKENIYNKGVQEINYTQREEPKDIVSFVRKNRYCDITKALEYFSKKEIDNAVLTGKIFKSNNKLYL